MSLRLSSRWSALTGSNRARARLPIESLERRLLLAGVSFSPMAEFPTGSLPNDVAVADLNNDSKLDLAITDYGGTTVSILLGNGDGTFQTRNSITAGTRPTALAIADLNGDGNADLAVTDDRARTVNVLLGNGDGTFGDVEAFDVGSFPFSLAIADLNGDANLDLAVANYGSGNVSVLLGKGDGTFEDQAIVPVAGFLSSIASADLNADGKADLVVVKMGFNFNTASVLLGNGDGTFQDQVTLPFDGTPSAVAIADLNHDDAPDLALTNQSDSTVRVFLGNGDGTFQADSPFATGSASNDLAIADINGDSNPDLAVSNRIDETISVLLGDGAGVFAKQTTFATGLRPFAIAIADFSGDGRPDLAVANNGSGTVGVLLNVPLTPPTLFISDDSGAPDDLAANLPDTPVGGTSGLATWSLTNDGQETLEITDLVINGADADQFLWMVQDPTGAAISGNAFSIPGGETYTVSVSLQPTSAGNKAAAITFNTNDPVNPAVTLTMSGQAATPQRELRVFLVNSGVSPLVQLEMPAAVSFGTMRLGKKGPIRTFRVKNMGAGTLNLGAVKLPKGYRLVKALPKKLAPRKSADFQVQLVATKAGTWKGSIRFSSDDPLRNPFVIAVTGKAKK